MGAVINLSDTNTFLKKELAMGKATPTSSVEIRGRYS